MQNPCWHQQQPQMLAQQATAQSQSQFNSISNNLVYAQKSISNVEPQSSMEEVKLQQSMGVAPQSSMGVKLQQSVGVEQQQQQSVAKSPNNNGWMNQQEDIPSFEWKS